MSKFCPMDLLDLQKVAEAYPFLDPTDVLEYPVYIKPGRAVEVKIDSRELEVAILAAFDYGLDVLNEDGKQQIEKLLADLKVAITGR